MSDADDPLAPGTLFGAYRIERRLGAGGVGAVYRATHTGLQKPVVLKVLHPQYAQSPNLRTRFAREGRAAAAIRHPHVVDVTDVGEHQGTPYLIMELLEGESLGDLIARAGALAPDRAVDLLLPVIAAVDAAHAAGVVHRDLKPDNLFVTRSATGEPFPKVLDFGISRVVAGDGQHRTGTAAMLGTPAYMAPEQIESTRDADARSDQYALGVILYECLTGHRAFEGENVYAILKRVGDGRFTSPRGLRPELSAALEALVLRAMSKNPAARFPSLRAMAAALLPFASVRTRVAWGTTFAPGGEHGHADTALSAASAPARNAAPDTLAEASFSQPSIAPVSPTRRRTNWIIGVAIVGLTACAGAILTSVLREAQAPRHAAPNAAPPPAANPPVAPPHAALTPPIAQSAAPSPPAVAPPSVASPPPPPPTPRPSKQLHGGRPRVRPRLPETILMPAHPSIPDIRP